MSDVKMYLNFVFVGVTLAIVYYSMISQAPPKATPVKAVVAAESSSEDSSSEDEAPPIKKPKAGVFNFLCLSM